MSVAASPFPPARRASPGLFCQVCMLAWLQPHSTFLGPPRCSPGAGHGSPPPHPPAENTPSSRKECAPCLQPHDTNFAGASLAPWSRGSQTWRGVGLPRRSLNNTRAHLPPPSSRRSRVTGVGSDLSVRTLKTSPDDSNVLRGLGSAARDQNHTPPALPPSSPALEMRPRMLPVSFGESIEVHPEPTHEIRCNSEVKYASERHFRDNVFYAPVPTVTAYSETIVAAPNCTWRNYRSQLTLEPRPRALHFRSTTIIFPKRARSTFRTTLHCSLGRPSRRFTSSVQLQLLLGPAAL
ncbi:refilin-A isoform X1 [Panthera pardus]|uniref:Refilin-A isoform X1 n=2 Tax=Panthera TaxID=9688 RepID=A0A9V1GIM1_PANPR|nr:refilin-A isoform X1 [Panthera pardus]